MKRQQNTQKTPPNTSKAKKEIKQKTMEDQFRKIIVDALKNNGVIDICTESFHSFHVNLSIYCNKKVGSFNSDFLYDWCEQFDASIVEDEIDNYVKRSLADLLKKISESRESCYIIIPLPFCKINKSIKIGKDCFIIDSFKLKCNNASRLLFFGQSIKKPVTVGRIIEKILKKEIQEDSLIDILSLNLKSPSFSDYPLLIIKDREVFKTFVLYTKEFEEYAKSCLWLMSTSNNAEETTIITRVNYHEIEHCIIGSPKNTPSFYYLGDNPIDFPFELNYFLKENNKDFLKNRYFFAQMLSLWNSSKPLARLYRRSLTFFTWNYAPRYKDVMYMPIRIQMLFTGIEIMFFSGKRTREKRGDIALLLDSLTNLYNYKRIEEAVDDIYDLRCDYIHNGKADFYK